MCHATTPGEKKIGPSLAGIVGSKSGTVPGFDFSPAMKNANVTWDDANLDKFLANPTGFIHGTKMFVNLPNETISPMRPIARTSLRMSIRSRNKSPDCGAPSAQSGSVVLAEFNTSRSPLPLPRYSTEHLASMDCRAWNDQ
jgi:hypothetical protein